MDREIAMNAIEKTFEENKKPIKKHPSKPNVYAVETLNIFPDFKVIIYFFNTNENTVIINAIYLELEISMCSCYL